MTKMDTRLGLCLVENKGLEVQRKEDKYLEKPSFGDKKNQKKKVWYANGARAQKRKKLTRNHFRGRDPKYISQKQMVDTN